MYTRTRARAHTHTHTHTHTHARAHTYRNALKFIYKFFYRINKNYYL